MYESLVFCLDSFVSREGVQRKALVKSFDHFENTELQKPDDKAVNLARIELSIGVALTVAGVAATVFCPLPIQVTRARNLTQFLRDHISEYKDEEAKRYKVNLKEFNEYKLQKTGYVYPEEVRTIVTATKNELEQKIKQERSKKYKSMETSRKPIFSKSKIRSVENVFGFNKKNSSAAVHTKIYQKPKPAAINEHHANNPSSNSHENYADWIPQFLALNLIAMTKNYYELVNEVCTQYILLVRMMPAYKLSGPAPKFCKQDFQDYEWLTQSEVDLITCKSYEEVDANLSIGFADVFAQDSAEDNKVSTSVKPPVKEMKIVSGKPPSTPSSFKMFWPWSSSPAADGSSKN
uniref:PrgI family protein n=1 Tax=Ditylenchus dipsaci TaxID=166011 RepID=A0A915DNE3_9BILA